MADPTRNFNIRLPVPLLEQLDAMAGSRSEAVRRLLIAHLEGPLVTISGTEARPRQAKVAPPRVTGPPNPASHVSGSPKDHAACRITRPGGRPWCLDHQLWVR